jgi:transposase
MSSLTDLADVVIGVDTHVETHSAAVVDAGTGAVLHELTVPATLAGYTQLLEAVSGHDPGRVWAIEGTGSHGAGLTRFLTEHDQVVIELDRPQRPARRHGAKSDPLDAIRAAREALSREHLGTPRSGGDRQALSVLLATRRSAVQGATVAQVQLFSLILAAPEPVRARFRGLGSPQRLARAANLRSRPGQDSETTATITALRTLARRARTLQAEAADLHDQIHHLVTTTRPDLLDQPGIGPISAATILCAWSHPGRVRNEAAFAMLAGVAPIPANSGKTTTRYRLNRHGDRQLNQALHLIALTRRAHHAPTRAYVQRRTAEGKTPREITRCIKRYIARDLYRLLEHPPALLDRT